MIIQGKEIDLKAYRRDIHMQPGYVGTSDKATLVLDALENILSYAEIPLTMSCFASREDLERHRHFAEQVRKCVEDAV